MSINIELITWQLIIILVKVIFGIITIYTIIDNSEKKRESLISGLYISTKLGVNTTQMLMSQGSD